MALRFPDFVCRLKNAGSPHSGSRMPGGAEPLGAGPTDTALCRLLRGAVFLQNWISVTKLLILPNSGRDFSFLKSYIKYSLWESICLYFQPLRWADSLQTSLFPFILCGGSAWREFVWSILADSQRGLSKLNLSVFLVQLPHWTQCHFHGLLSACSLHFWGWFCCLMRSHAERSCAVWYSSAPEDPCALRRKYLCRISLFRVWVILLLATSPELTSQQ